MGKIYKTSKGRVIDMDALRAQSANSPAVGNMKVNGRGDLLGAGGKVVEPVTSRTRRLHKENPRAVQEISLKKTSENEDVKLEDVKENMPNRKATSKRTTKKKTIPKTNEVELEDGSIEIVKDKDQENDGDD
jgi:hypothetical protein